ncbi:hypothetical protein FACS189492_0980 [Clostridia bacterium]|nr:hypothetical protein FACS189492_0980 [Clostridia bacterium]
MIDLEFHDPRDSDFGPHIVAFGGGTGLSTMLRGLKRHTNNLTAVVTVADDGGGSGMLRQDLGMLPPGDIRNCILALAETEPLMEKLLRYRFPEGRLRGQSFGNLFLAAMTGISSSFEEAVQNMSDVLRVTGRVLPVTGDDVELEAVLDNGATVRGESHIAAALLQTGAAIRSVRLMPCGAQALPDVVEAIGRADVVVLGPGSLYTSIIPNILVGGVAEALRASAAPKVYVCNIMTQPGETDGMTAFDHADAIRAHGGTMSYCIVNGARVPEALRKKYIEDGAAPVTPDRARFAQAGIDLIEEDLLHIRGDMLRHDYEKLANMIINLRR